MHQKNFQLWVPLGYCRGSFLAMAAQKIPKLAQNGRQKSAKISDLSLGVPWMVLGGTECIWKKFRCFVKNIFKNYEIWVTLGYHSESFLAVAAPKVPKKAKISQKWASKKRKNHQSASRGARNGAGGVPKCIWRKFRCFLRNPKNNF